MGKTTEITEMEIKWKEKTIETGKGEVLLKDEEISKEIMPRIMNILKANLEFDGEE